jgi:SAM-dependent methyltransferase
MHVSVKRRILAVASQRFPRFSSRFLSSAGYTRDMSKFGTAAFGNWSQGTVDRQARAWHPIIDAARAGRPRKDVAALEAALSSLPAEGALLEVGCGGGYNSEIISIVAPTMRYTGLDISEANVAVSRESYPDREFVVGSAYDLPYPDASFDVVVDGVALIQLEGWKQALSEYARVARDAVVLHSVTLCDGPTTEFAKYAYGQPTFEIVFRRSDLEEEVARLGLRIASIEPGEDYDLAEFLDIPSVSETWVLRRA